MPRTLSDEPIRYMHEHLEQLYKTTCTQYETSIKKKEIEIAYLKEQLDSINYNTNTEKNKLFIYEILRERIKNNKKISEKAWEEIILLTDKAFPGFKAKIIGIYGMDYDEYKISILVKLGLLNIEIASLMCKSPSAITQKRISMYKKIFKKKGSSKDFDSFIKNL